MLACLKSMLSAVWPTCFLRCFNTNESCAAFKCKSLLVATPLFLGLFKMRAYVSHILLLSEIQNPVLYCYARKC